MWDHIQVFLALCLKIFFTLISLHFCHYKPFWFFVVVFCFCCATNFYVIFITWFFKNRLQIIVFQQSNVNLLYISERLITQLRLKISYQYQLLGYMLLLCNQHHKSMFHFHYKYHFHIQRTRLEVKYKVPKNVCIFYSVKLYFQRLCKFFIFDLSFKCKSYYNC